MWDAPGPGARRTLLAIAGKIVSADRDSEPGRDSKFLYTKFLDVYIVAGNLIILARPGSYLHRPEYNDWIV